jgi:hypothetical protein
MNKARRKWLEDIYNRLEVLKDELENISAEEQDAYDNLPEGIQDSERGDVMEENVSDIDDAASSIEEIMDTIQDIIDR